MTHIGYPQAIHPTSAIDKLHLLPCSTSLYSMHRYVSLPPAPPPSLPAPPRQVFLRSLRSAQQVSVTFVNRTAHPAVAIWLNFFGQEVAYGKLPPGEAKL